MEMKSQFLSRDITIRKTDGTFIRGLCILENSLGVTVSIRDVNRSVFVPFTQVSEIIVGDER